jgi:hypothetical protein
MVKLALVLVYPLLVISRLSNGLAGRDPLRLKQPHQGSFWISRPAQTDNTSYFSPGSILEGKAHAGFGFLACRPLRWVAWLFAPTRRASDELFIPGGEREGGIPDEVYTLW